MHEGVVTPRHRVARARSRLPGTAALRWRLPRSSSAVVLTFDDGPDPTATPALLNVLSRHGVQATFFVLTEFSRRCVGTLLDAAAAGHEIGLHGDVHEILAGLPRRQSERRLIGARRFLEDSLQRPVAMYRPPEGVTSLALLRAARAAGLDVVLWSRDPRDWDEGSSRPLTGRLARCIETGEIVLLHDGGGGPGGDRDSTAAALGAVLPAAIARGLTFRSLAEAVAPARP